MFTFLIFYKFIILHNCVFNVLVVTASSIIVVEYTIIMHWRLMVIYGTYRYIPI